MLDASMPASSAPSWLSFAGFRWMSGMFMADILVRDRRAAAKLVYSCGMNEDLLNSDRFDGRAGKLRQGERSGAVGEVLAFGCSLRAHCRTRHGQMARRHRGGPDMP